VDGLPRLDVKWRDPQGNLAECKPNPCYVQATRDSWLSDSCLGCSVSYTYSGNGLTIAETWDFYIAGQQRSPGTYTAVISQCTYILPVNPTVCVTWQELFRTNFFISGNPATKTISGNAGISAATMNYVDGTAKTSTADGTGNYTITIPTGWSGTVIPSKPGYIFQPANRSFNNVQADQTEQNFSATVVVGLIYLPLVIR
jgi:hypothetical protein